MRQYTTPEQTAKLIDLGFKKPRIIVDSIIKEDGQFKGMTRYTIGELLELFPYHIGMWTLEICYDHAFERWFCFFNPTRHFSKSTELADALFKLLVNLKETGEI